MGLVNDTKKENPMAASLSIIHMTPATAGNPAHHVRFAQCRPGGARLARRVPLLPTTKWTVYEQILHVPYYVLFSRYTDDAQFFVLSAGQYTQVHPVEQRLWLPEAGLEVGVWEGSYQGLARHWLRFYNVLYGVLAMLAFRYALYRV
jgi:hypothetical protein